MSNQYVREVKCPYCGNQAHFVPGTVIYPHRPDLANKSFWYCQPCNAWVGTHKNSNAPLGELADANTRSWRIKAHAIFDQIWLAEVVAGEKKNVARNKAYEWLAQKIGIDIHHCHIGMMDVSTCLKVIIVCNTRNQGEQ